MSALIASSTGWRPTRSESAPPIGNQQKLATATSSVTSKASVADRFSVLPKSGV